MEWYNSTPVFLLSPIIAPIKALSNRLLVDSCFQRRQSLSDESAAGARR